MTGSGTNIDVNETFVLPSVKVVPDEQSTPNMAVMSPAEHDSTSSISFACIRTKRGIRTFFLSAAIEKTVSPRLILPCGVRREAEQSRRARPRHVPSVCARTSERGGAGAGAPRQVVAT